MENKKELILVRNFSGLLFLFFSFALLFYVTLYYSKLKNQTLYKIYAIRLSQNLSILSEFIVYRNFYEIPHLLKKIKNQSEVLPSSQEISLELKKLKSLLSIYMETRNYQTKIACINKIYSIERKIEKRFNLSNLELHYHLFYPLLIEYLKDFESFSFWSKEFLKEYKKLFPKNPIPKNLLSLAPIFSMDKNFLNFFETRFKKKFLDYKKNFYISLLATLLLLYIFLLFLYSLFLSYKRGIQNLEFFAQNIKEGNFEELKNYKVEGNDLYAKGFRTLQRSCVEIFNFLKEVEKSVSHLTQGKIYRISEIELKGDLERIGDHINSSLNQVEMLIRIISEMEKHLFDSKYKVQINGNISGFWKEMVERLIFIKTSFDQIILNIKKIFFNLTQGNFKEIYCIVDPKNELLEKVCKEINEALDEYIKNFYSLISELRSLSLSISTISSTHPGNLKLHKKNFKGEYFQLLYAFEVIIEKLHELNSTYYNLLEIEKDLTQFRKTLEEDINLDLSLERIRKMLKNKFGIENFVLFEILPKKDLMEALLIEGNSVKCNPTIFTNASRCRAKRIGEVVAKTSEKFGEVCPQFQGEEYYLCVPYVFGGQILYVLQIFFKDKQTLEEFKEKKLHLLNKYIDASIPVLEFKKLKSFRQ